MISFMVTSESEDDCDMILKQYATLLDNTFCLDLILYVTLECNRMDEL